MFFSKKAPEIVNIDDDDWINSEPLTLEKLRGDIVLLNFWDYSCMKCLRTLPALKEMWEKYRGKGVVIIGVHTPDFDFGRDVENLRTAVKKHDIGYHIANDPNRANWQRYGKKHRPKAVLINDKGEIIMEHVGESGYSDIDSKIIEELRRMNIPFTYRPISERRRYHISSISPAAYAGSMWDSKIGSKNVRMGDGSSGYIDPGSHRRDIIYPQGNWIQSPEYLEFVGGEGYISFQFCASEVNVVLSGMGMVEVLLHEKPLRVEDAGADIVFDKERSYVKVDNPDTYNIIRLKDFASYEVKLIPFNGMRVYAYTFG